MYAKRLSSAMILAKWLEMCSIALVYHILLIEEGTDHFGFYRRSV